MHEQGPYLFCQPVAKIKQTVWTHSTRDQARNTQYSVPTQKPKFTLR